MSALQLNSWPRATASGPDLKAVTSHRTPKQDTAHVIVRYYFALSRRIAASSPSDLVVIA
jgi:hypothetical protein